MPNEKARLNDTLKILYYVKSFDKRCFPILDDKTSVKVMLYVRQRKFVVYGVLKVFSVSVRGCQK